jgi:hypothetical protein
MEMGEEVRRIVLVPSWRFRGGIGELPCPRLQFLAVAAQESNRIPGIVSGTAFPMSGLSNRRRAENGFGRSDQCAQRRCTPVAARRVIGQQNAPPVLNSFVIWLDARNRSVAPQDSVWTPRPNFAAGRIGPPDWRTVDRSAHCSASWDKSRRHPSKEIRDRGPCAFTCRNGP